ncbi:hypothetical protein KAU11_05680 [Candidatus Babeliales bacterium]|nr:hypothetical protein [Candidatus Babeliales bacterium]
MKKYTILIFTILTVIGNSKAVAADSVPKFEQFTKWEKGLRNLQATENDTNLPQESTNAGTCKKAWNVISTFFAPSEEQSKANLAKNISQQNIMEDLTKVLDKNNSVQKVFFNNNINQIVGSFCENNEDTSVLPQEITNSINLMEKKRIELTAQHDKLLLIHNRWLEENQNHIQWAKAYLGKSNSPILDKAPFPALRNCNNRKELLENLIDFKKMQLIQTTQCIKIAETIFEKIPKELREKGFDTFAKNHHQKWIKKRNRLLTISSLLLASGITIHVAESWVKAKRKELAKDLLLIQKSNISKDAKHQIIKERKKAYAKYLPNWIKRLLFGYDLKKEINAFEEAHTTGSQP